MTLAAMTAAASQLDNAAPDDVEITDSSAAAEYIADGCLVDGPLGRVGLEMEAHCFDPADPFRRPSWEEITEVLEWLSPLPGGSVVSVEPGGAVELSGPPADGVLASHRCHDARSGGATVGACQCRAGFGLPGCRPAAVAGAGQSGRTLSGHGAVFRRQP